MISLTVILLKQQLLHLQLRLKQLLQLLVINLM